MDTGKTRKEIYEEYLTTPHWQGLRKASFAKWGCTCRACGATHNIQAHHLFYRDPLTECTPDDIMPLCDSCHEKLHTLPYIIQNTAMRGNRKKRVLFVLEQLFNSFGIGEKPQKKKGKRRKGWKQRRARINALLANPGRGYSKTRWVNYQDTRVANEFIPIWELPVRNRSTGPIDVGGRRKK